MSSYKDVSDNGSRFLTFSKLLKQDKETYSILLEEVNKTWGLPYNWRMTVNSINVLDKQSFLFQEKFYLNADNFSIENAQKAADNFVSNYLKALV